MVRKRTSEASAPSGDSVATLVDQLSLWPHQREAVDKMREYMSSFRRGLAEGSALVHMPTGSGKTGVIATSARCVPETGCVLVLTPRIALREQLARDIGGRFFGRLASRPDDETGKLVQARYPLLFEPHARRTDSPGASKYRSWFAVIMDSQMLTQVSWSILPQRTEPPWGDEG